MAKWTDKELNSETHLWKMYLEGIDGQIKLGIRHNIPKYVDFYEGRQWPQATESTKNLPRPVVNIVKMICRSKKSAILSVPVKILFKSYNKMTDTEKLNSFAQSILKELNQEGIDKLAIDDGIKKGSYFYHYYWDKDASSPFGINDGGLRCEIIDPLNIFFSNPQELDEQKQRWILISSRLELNRVLEMCESNADLTKIQPDKDKNGTTVTVLTRYFRLNNEIWCERGTRTAIINKPFRLTPDKTALPLPFGLESSQGTEKRHETPTIHTPAGLYKSLPIGKKGAFKATLYPIVSGYYERREGSIYGISEVEGIIPNQKAINFNIAMSLLNAQQCAWGKYIALPNALKGQKISNSPGQVLIDHSGTGNGIKRMSEESLSQVPMAITSELTQLTRTFTGSSEILSGEMLNTSLSGVAIAQLQAQAEVPLEELRSNFYEAKRKQGLVLAQFMKLYYYNRLFLRTKTDENGCECEFCDTFSSSDYENSVLDITVEPIRGTKASISSDINLLNTCLNNGSISLEAYIKAYPEGAITNKQEILKQLEQEKNSEIEKLRKELNEYKNRKTLDPVSIK